MSAPASSPKLQALTRLIGGTPLLEIHCLYRGHEHRIYAKHEAYNFTGSIKDRMALYILQRAYASGEIGPGDTIAEATSGNTGISFAAIGRALGHPVRIYMPDWMSRERVLVIQSLGAAVIPVSAELGGFQGSIRMADEFARQTSETKSGHVFRPQQFDNTANVQAHYETTGPEITAQLASLGRTPTAFVAGILDVWDGDAIVMSQRLASQLGIAVGISSGANLLGALEIAHDQGASACVVTVFCDDNKKYLSTDLCSDEECKEHYRVNEVKLLDFRVIPPAGAASG
jgi:cysteine synthase